MPGNFVSTGGASLADDGENVAGEAVQGNDARVNYDILTVGPFARANPAANTTGQAATLGTAGGEAVIPAGATLIGIGVWFSGTHTLGTATVKARKNGSASTTLVATSGTTDTKWNSTGTGASWTAGDSVGAEVDTNAAWNGTSGTINIVFYFKIAKF